MQSVICVSPFHRNLKSPSAVGVSDPVIESQEIEETQEFPSILKMLKGAKKTQGAKGVEGSMKNGEKQ